MKKICLLLLIFLLLVSCQTAGLNPVKTVQGYLNALISKDAAKLVSFSCRGWENQAQQELDSFLNVGLSEENINCKNVSQTAGASTVQCTGYIKLTYDSEIQKIDLSTHAYELIMENNEWRVCNLK
jgi:hypothetical protein